LWALLVLTGCGSSTADPIGIGGGANDLKRSRCAGAAGSPCVEITAPPPAGAGFDRWRDDLARQIGGRADLARFAG
jgi:hypothetical protein